MIMQTIKRWLQKMFAWWPWKSTPETDYAHAVSTLNISVSQESSSRASLDGLAARPENTSVAVEHVEDTLPPETYGPLPTPEERSEQPVTQSSPPVLSSQEDLDGIARTSSKDTEKEPRVVSSDNSEHPSPTDEQRLEFLRYLMKHRLVHEDFTEGKEPHYYRNP